MATGRDGALYATTASGTILRIVEDTAAVSEFAHAGGRPLGIEAAADGALLVANAFVGIQRISPLGEVTDLVTAIDGDPVLYADNLPGFPDNINSGAQRRFGVGLELPGDGFTSPACSATTCRTWTRTACLASRVPAGLLPA